eukprot:3279981-Rhodomonas_salina.1
MTWGGAAAGDGQTQAGGQHCEGLSLDTAKSNSRKHCSWCKSRARCVFLYLILGWTADPSAANQDRGA